MTGKRKLYLLFIALFVVGLGGNLLYLRLMDMNEKLRLSMLREQGWVIWAKEGVSSLQVPLLLDKEPNYILGGQMKGVGINLGPYAGQTLRLHTYELLSRSDFMAEPVRAVFVEKGGRRLGVYIMAGESRGIVPVTTKFFVGRDVSYRGVNKVRILHNRPGVQTNWDVFTEVADSADKNALLLMLGAAEIQSATTAPGGENTVLFLEYYGGSRKALKLYLAEQSQGSEQVLTSEIYPGTQFKVGGGFRKIVSGVIHSPEAGGAVPTQMSNVDRFRR